jgi:spore germination protein GerM
MSKGGRVFLVIFLLCACLAGGVYYALQNQPMKVSPTAPAPPAASQPQVVEEKPVTIYHIEMDKDQPVLRSSEVSGDTAKDPIEIALVSLIKQGDKPGMANPIPKGTHLLDWKLKSGLITVNLSHEFKDNFTGGAETEGLTIDSITRTLGQFPKIKRVRILVEGQTIDTLGNIDLSHDLDVQK